jgi:copper homeostasis protein CutC
MLKYSVEFFDYLYSIPNPEGFEHLMYFISRQYDRLIIMDREPLSADNTRWFCDKLGWTMSHFLKTNLEFKENYISNNELVTFKKIEGTQIPYNLDQSKCEI